MPESSLRNLLMALFGLLFVAPAGCKKQPPGCTEYMRLLESYADEARSVGTATRGSSPEKNLERIERWIARQAEVLAELDAVEGSESTAGAVKAVRSALEATAELYASTLEDLRAAAAEDAEIIEVEKAREAAEEALRASCRGRSDCAEILAALAAIDGIPDGASVNEIIDTIRTSIERIVQTNHSDANVRKHAREFAEAKGRWAELADKLLRGDPRRPSKEQIATHRKVQAQFQTAVRSMQELCGGTAD
jgi:hypothetical protein